MGCYDMIFLEVECPYCGQRSKIEFQTKDLDSMFCVYQKGDLVKNAGQLKYLNVIGTCHSPKCQERADKRWISIQGCPSGSGTPINACVELKGGVVTGKIHNIQIDECYTDAYINRDRELWKEKYKKRKSSDWAAQLWNKQKR